MKFLFPFAFLLCGVTLSAATLSIDYDEVYNVLPTGSMEPAFNEHYLLYVKRLPFRDIKVGDVVLAQYPLAAGWPDVPVCHRVVRKSSGGSVIVLRGDARPSEDGVLVDESMYVGTVVVTVRVD